MALLVMVSVSLGHFETFIRLLDMLLEGNYDSERDKSSSRGRQTRTVVCGIRSSGILASECRLINNQTVGRLKLGEDSFQEKYVHFTFTLSHIFKFPFQG